MDIIDAAVQRDIVLLLAIGVVTLAGVVAFLFKLLLAEKTARVKRAEELTDKMVESFDGLEDATKTAVLVAEEHGKLALKAAELAQHSLDELRRR